ncbi:MAG: hypothetical protein Q7V05_13990 [Methanoregula sp.]|nr:hypothetical protein [Methanoregula sp.]
MAKTLVASMARSATDRSSYSPVPESQTMRASVRQSGLAHNLT